MKMRAKRLKREKYEAELEKGFEELVLLLKERENQVRSYNRRNPIFTLPETTAEFYEKFSLLPTHLAFGSKKKYALPSSEEGIQYNLVISLLLVIPFQR